MKGFTITILKETFKVQFLHPNEKVTICEIMDNINLFKGISKCNFAEGDKYDKVIGERIALHKALEKREHKIRTVYQKFLKNVMDRMYKQNFELESHYIKKMNKEKK